METIIDQNIHSLLANRRSIRAFSAEPVSAEKIQTLFEAARWAASAMNEQPWRYIYATKENPESYAALLDCLVPANQVWAKEAPVLVLSIAKTFFDNQQTNNHAWYDVGAANTTLALQATAEGLYVHQMGGFNADKAKAHFYLPAGYEPVVMMAIGYEGEADALPEPLRQRELATRQRKQPEQFVFENTWTPDNF